MMRRRSLGVIKYGAVLCTLAIVPLLAAGCDGGSSGTGSMIGRHVEVGISDFDGIVPGLGAICGVEVVQELTAGQFIDIGDITISNDNDMLFIQIDTDDPWVVGTVQVHVGVTVDDFPQTPQGQPIPGQFDFKHERDPGDVVSHDEFEIDFADPVFDPALVCGQTLYIWVHADSFRLDDNDDVIQEETAFGGDTPCEDTPRWCFIAIYQIQCCDNGEEDGGEFRTQTMGGWGTFCHGGNPGCYRNEWFETAFPDGIVLGCTTGWTATFDTSEDIRDFLPSGGKPGSLTADVENPTAKTDAGVLLGQLLALELSLGFDMADGDFGASDNMLADQVVCGTETACDGMTVAQVADEANLILGGCDSDFSAAEIAECLAIINENFVDGEVNQGFVCSPE